MTLTARELELLDFEETWGTHHTSRKEEAIHVELQLRPARYYVLILRLANNPEAIARNPQTLRRVRDRVAEHHDLTAKTPRP